MKQKSKSRNIIHDILFVYSGYFLRYLSVIVLIPFYGRVLGPAAYGKVLAAMSLMSIVWIIVIYGFSTLGARELAFAERSDRYGPIFGSQLAGRIILAPVGIAVGILGTVLSPTLSDDPVFGLMATLIGLSYAMNLGWFYQGLRKFKLSIAFEGLTYILNLVLVLSFVRTQSDGIYVLVGIFLASLITNIIAYFFAFKFINIETLSFRGGGAQIKHASTFFVQSVNSIIMTTGSTYLLSVMAAPEEVAYFGSVEKLISFALAFLGPASQVLMPSIAQRLLVAPEGVRSIIQRSVLLEIGYGLIAAFIGFSFARLIILTAFGDHFGSSIVIMKIIVWSIPFAAFSHAFGLYVLVPQKREGILVLCITAGNLLNLLLIAIFYKNLHGTDVAVARVVGEAATACSLVACAVYLRSAPKILGVKNG